ncbi:SecY-interacting protein [Shewanella sp. NIFS-20-20]|uniref:SecY-interacting protein n=1 Tax=Shewanella sp. NIFS-20-20 TaxID=2853806 RepID=UPI001C43F10F|nr:SecY-interacting protein [Shewanella sp. NIFS-20-20]MBV7317331.1 SecY-interacting protein [Shewanella sp. NIFS-20-20]
MTSVSCDIQLNDFLTRYIHSYQEQLGELPRCYPQGMVSECLRDPLAEDDISMQWQWVSRSSVADFTNIELALGIKFWPDMVSFYGKIYAGTLYFHSEQGVGELLQTWNDDDLDILQKNLIGHIMMKQKLKQPLTWFIGLLADGDRMITVNNQDGSVWTEVPGHEQEQRLAASLGEYLQLLTPRVCLPEVPVVEAMPERSHPGIIQRLKIMWRHLTGQK